MRKYILYLATLMMALTSCADTEEVEMKYQVKITISPENVIKPFAELKKGDFQLTDELSLQITALIYDEQGFLQLKSEGIIKSYNETYSFSGALPNGTYTIIALSSVMTNDGETRLWVYQNENNLSTLSIKNPGKTYGESFLGLSEQNISVTNEKKDELIRLEPAVSLLTVKFENWSDTYFKSLEGKLNGYYTNFEFLYTCYKQMNYQKHDWVYSNDLTLDYYYVGALIDVEYWIGEYEKAGEDYSTPLYGHFPLLPGNYTYACNNTTIFNDGRKVETTFPGNGKMSLEKGKQYILTLDCKNRTFEFSSASNTDRTFLQINSTFANKPLNLFK